jgi:hypothetical protein
LRQLGWAELTCRCREDPETAGELPAAFLRRYDDRRATQGAYALDLADWFVWLARAATGPLEATLVTIESYKREPLLDGKAPAPSTMARRLACLSHFYRRAQVSSAKLRQRRDPDALCLKAGFDF